MYYFHLKWVIRFSCLKGYISFKHLANMVLVISTKITNPITKINDETFWVVSSGAAEGFQQRFFNLIELDEDTKFTSKTSDYCGFNVAGPKSRDLLQRLSNKDLSTEAWPFFKSGSLAIAGIECVALRVSFTGDLGWELYCDEHDQLALYEVLIKSASQIGGGPVGSRALMSLRLEKGYGSWGREYSLSLIHI